MTNQDGYSDNGTALAVRNTESLERFGDRAEIREMFGRIKQMIPGATEAPDAVVLATAQMAVAHGLDIFNDEIYIMKIKDKRSGNVRYIPHVGIRGLKNNADGKFMFEDSDEYPRRLSDEELKADLGDVKPGTIGIEVRVYNLKKARECQAAGIPYFPRKERGYWSPGEQIPATRTAAWVAQKRAEKMALRAEFGLSFVRQASDDDALEYLEFKDRQGQRERALPAPRPRGNMDDDLDALWASAQASNQQSEPDEEEGEYRDVDWEDEESLWGDDADDIGERSPSYERLEAEGTLTFGSDWEAARGWVVELYTRRKTPDDVRYAIEGLNNDECDLVADSLAENRGKYQKLWRQKAQKATA